MTTFDHAPPHRGWFEPARWKSAAQDNHDTPAKLDAESIAGEDEGILVAQARGGDSEAFGKLVERYSTRIYTHLFRMVQRREEAEDLAQESFIRAYRYFDRYDAKRPFRNWLYAIATNVGLNALRLRQRDGISISLDGVDGAVCADSTFELRDSLVSAMTQLNVQSALLVHLHYHEGMPLKEAATVLNISEGAAKVALFRARKTLRELLIREDSE